MVELNSPESLSPNRLNQALISETLSEFSEFEFVPEAASASSMPTPILVQDPLLVSPNPTKKGTSFIRSPFIRNFNELDNKTPPL